MLYEYLAERRNQYLLGFFNMIVVYVVLRNVYLVERILGKSGVYILRKFFGIILLAMSVRIFTTNLNALLETLK